MVATASTGSALPWSRPRFEALLLTLVAVATLSPLFGFGDQDQSRLCLTEALLHGNVSNDTCLASAFDHSIYGGHLYSDKAPGLSMLAIPAVALVQPSSPAAWSSHDIRLWVVRVLTVGIAFVLCAFFSRTRKRGGRSRLGRHQSRDLRPRHAGRRRSEPSCSSTFPPPRWPSQRFCSRGHVARCSPDFSVERPFWSSMR